MRIRIVSVHIHAAVDADRLAGHEVAVVGGEKKHRADKILRILIALYWAPAALKLNEKEKCWFASTGHGHEDRLLRAWRLS